MSAPGGSGAPVMMRAASPGASGTSATLPAGISATMARPSLAATSEVGAR